MKGRGRVLQVVEAVRVVQVEAELSGDRATQMADETLRPRLQFMAEMMRAVTSACGLEYDASPQSMRTLMPAGGRMALPVTTQSKSLEAVSPLASVTVMVTVKVPGVISLPRMRRPTGAVSGGRSWKE